MHCIYCIALHCSLVAKAVWQPTPEHGRAISDKSKLVIDKPPTHPRPPLHFVARYTLTYIHFTSPPTTHPIHSYHSSGKQEQAQQSVSWTIIDSWLELLWRPSLAWRGCCSQLLSESQLYKPLPPSSLRKSTDHAALNLFVQIVVINVVVAVFVVIVVVIVVVVATITPIQINRSCWTKTLLAFVLHVGPKNQFE